MPPAAPLPLGVFLIVQLEERLGEGVFQNLAVHFISRLSPPPLALVAVFWLRGAVLGVPCRTSGAAPLPGPCGWIAARDETTSASSALCVAVRLLHWVTNTKAKRNLSEPVVGCWLLVVGCWLLVVGCWLLVVGCWLLVVGCWLLFLTRLNEDTMWYGHTMTRCDATQSLRLFRARSPGSKTPSDPGTPEPSSTHRCECSRAPKTVLRKRPGLPNRRGSSEYCPDSHYERRGPPLQPTDNRRTQREVHKYHQNQYNTCHCRCRRRARHCNTKESGAIVLAFTWEIPPKNHRDGQNMYSLSSQAVRKHSAQDHTTKNCWNLSLQFKNVDHLTLHHWLVETWNVCHSVDELLVQL